ncbi:hypothetical protein DB346_09425 [Verrucomicrobia bacterium LW23]|nr:hypothetical protein DB346_09425 [Verrucomicrobia bacterium LW23]
MNERDLALRERLWQVFRVEAQEHLETLSRLLLEMESALRAEAGGVGAGVVETAFREAHSLKGAARSVNQLDVESVCHGMELVLSRVKRGELTLTSARVDALLDGTRLTSQLLEAEDNKTAPPPIGITLSTLKSVAASGDAVPSARGPATAGAEADRRGGGSPITAAPPVPQFMGASLAPAGGSHQVEEPLPKPPPPPSRAPGAVQDDPELVRGHAASAEAEMLKALHGKSVSHQRLAEQLVPELSRPPREETPPELPPPVRQREDLGSAEETVRVSIATLDAVRTQAEELLADKLAIFQHARDLQALVTQIAEWPRRWSAVRDDMDSAIGKAAGPRSGQGRPRTRLVEEIPEHHVTSSGGTSYAMVGGQEAIARPHTSADMARAFMEWNAHFMHTLRSDLERMARSFVRDRNALAGRVDALLEGTRELLMLPFSWLLDSVHQPVRDLARSQGKEVQFVVEGQAVELDRRILSELKIPFMHMLRNSVDHGVETPDDRLAAGKPRFATIAVKVEQPRNGTVEVSITDDGRGIDTARVRAAALKAGLMMPAGEGETSHVPGTIRVPGTSDVPAETNGVQPMQGGADVQLIFGSGITTSPMITDISGHGLGLAIVREKIEKLGGTVVAETLPGRRTTLRLRLPLSLSIFRGVVVRVAERRFVLPVNNVSRVTRLAANQIRTFENRETILNNGEPVGVVRLAGLLGIRGSPSAHRQAPSPEPDDDKARTNPVVANGKGWTPSSQPRLTVVEATAGGAHVALVVDEVCGEQEVVSKMAGQAVGKPPCVVGATALGDGSLALILDVQELMRVSKASADAAVAPARPETEAPTRRRILVVDDSITSRTLLRSILDSAGFVVETAVDGIDALARLRSSSFDMVVTDVDMPRLHGVGLTEKIRADKRLSEMPVVLVTSLDSREDRERGLMAGANAYIVKRNFEESNLLDTIHRLF